MRLILPSNSSAPFYPENKLNDFSVRLPRELHLDGSCEVGLEELSCLQSWYNVGYLDDLTFFLDAPLGQRDPMKLPGGYYPSLEKLAKVVSSMFASSAEKKPLRLTYIQKDHRMMLHVPPGKTAHMSSTAARVLGFAKTGPFVCTGTPPNYLRVLGDRPPAEKRVQMLHVYCDLVAPHPVGDEIVPFLRSIPTSNEHLTFLTKTYRDVHYFPVARNTVSDLRVYIGDEEGEPVPFEYGKVVATLHLRRKRSAS
jgi:hypothetical protein